MSHEASLRAIVSSHFDTLASTYDQKAQNRRNYLGKIDDCVVHMLKSGLQQPVVLDAGTGTAARLEQLRLRFPGSRMIGLDTSSEMAHLANEKDIDGLIRGDMSSLPIRDESLDYVFCFFNAFGYVPSEAGRLATLREFFRVLTPGGHVMIDLLNRWHTGEGLGFKKSKRQISRELARSRETGYLEAGDVLFNLPVDGKVVPGYFHSFTKREADHLFNVAGFTIEDFRVIGYDSGETHLETGKGNFFYALRKPKE